jgi:hypothetical protein
MEQLRLHRLQQDERHLYPAGVPKANLVPFARHGVALTERLRLGMHGRCREWPRHEPWRSMLCNPQEEIEVHRAVKALVEESDRIDRLTPNESAGLRDSVS